MLVLPGPLGSPSPPLGTVGQNEGLRGDPLLLEDSTSHPGMLGGACSSLEAGLCQEPWNQVSPLPPSLRQPQKLTIKSGRKSKLFIYTFVCTLEFLKETASESLLLFG